MPNNLDPEPSNELGRGLIDPEKERWLLANGYVYARRITCPDGQTHLRISKRPIMQALADAFRDRPVRQQPVNSAAPVKAG